MIYEGQARVIRNEISVDKLKLNKVLFKTKTSLRHILLRNFVFNLDIFKEMNGNRNDQTIATSTIKIKSHGFINSNLFFPNMIRCLLFRYFDILMIEYIQNLQRSSQREKY